MLRWSPCPPNFGTHPGAQMVPSDPHQHKSGKCIAATSSPDIQPEGGEKKGLAQGEQGAGVA